MVIRPLSWRQCCAFIAQHHRHNKPPRGGKVFLGMFVDDQLIGVGVLGRPSARAYDPLRVCEITRTCTDGTPNGNSKLYGAFRQIAKAMGYEKVITYTQADESGASLKAAGFVLAARLPPRANWANSSQALKHIRDSSLPENVERCRWEIVFTANR